MTSFINSFQRYCGSKILASIILVNAGVFLAAWIVVLTANSLGAEGNVTMQWLCVSSSPGIFIRKPWTIATYMITHFDFLHLLFNMLWLYWFGIILHNVIPARRVLWLYIGGGICGALFYVAANALSPLVSPAGSYLCGASACVLAIMTAAAFFSPDRKVNLLLFGAVKLKWLTLACIALTFLGLGGGNPGAQSAHVGGVVFGAVFSLLSRMPSRKSRSHFSMPKPARTNVKRDGKAVAEAAAGRLSDETRLDQLLDKIRISGYQSLSSVERNELNALSKRIEKMESTK